MHTYKDNRPRRKQTKIINNGYVRVLGLWIFFLFFIDLKFLM